MNTLWLKNQKYKILNSSLIQNSVWGIAANVLQILFVCLFFAIVARKYSPNEFGSFLISTTVYQIVAAFSSMGLGQWFIRQYVLEDDKVGFISKFFKTQIGLGILFYFVNILLAYLIYPDPHIRLLCIILGTNIIFDNLINAIRTLNIAEGLQKKTAVILVIDGFFKLLVGCLLFIHPFSAAILSVWMIAVRILTLGLFIKLGSSNSITLKLLWLAKISYDDLKILIIKNWQFIVIGSISIVYWKIGNIIISKMLTLANVADYEIAFRIFSILQILPVIASATIYPQFIKYFNERDYAGLKKFYKNIFLFYTFFAITSYAFIYTFAPTIIPLSFGKSYPGAIVCLQQMFLTFLLLPTVLLQANLLVTIGLEKLDMWFNIISLVINVACCLVGLHYIKDLSVVNYAVFGSFLVFHVSQDIVLMRKKLLDVQHCLFFYSAILLTVWCCFYFGKSSPYLFFPVFFAVIILIGLASFLLQKGRYGFLGSLQAASSQKIKAW
ncbi:oligosaccharide flippase family protein [Mucilaginibacter sp. AW1-3]